jgi:hypothetical protein
MSATAAERKLLDVLEPYVLMSASTLITSAFQGKHTTFALLSRPQIARATVSEGRVDFELPEWFPIDEALLSAADCGIRSIVKHLPWQRMTGPGNPPMRRHRFKVGRDLCRDGETVLLAYSPWLRFAAPPYDFELEHRMAAYVGAALAHLGRSAGLGARLESTPELSVVWLSERLRVEVVGADELTDITVLFDGDESAVSFVNPQLSVARRMFPDVYAALRSARDAGEQFRGASLLVEEDQAWLHSDEGADDVQA